MRPAALLILLAVLPLRPVAPSSVPTRQASVVTAQADAWVWPVRSARVVHAYDRPAEPWLPGHRGVDLAARRGSPVRAAGDGLVVFAGSVAGVPVVTVQHADGLRTTYQPVDPEVRTGEPVEAGQRIGRLGVTGGHCAPDACLHWGLLRGADYLDPLLLVAPVAVRLLPLGEPPPAEVSAGRQPDGVDPAPGRPHHRGRARRRPAT